MVFFKYFFVWSALGIKKLFLCVCVEVLFVCCSLLLLFVKRGDHSPNDLHGRRVSQLAGLGLWI